MQRVPRRRSSTASSAVRNAVGWSFSRSCRRRMRKPSGCSKSHEIRMSLILPVSSASARRSSSLVSRSRISGGSADELSSSVERLAFVFFLLFFWGGMWLAARSALSSWESESSKTSPKCVHSVSAKSSELVL